jgi:uncharacterized protein
MLADFLLTPKQQRILGAFLLNPARSFAISDLFELVEGGRSSTQSFVKQLLDARIVRLDETARTTRYRVNPQHPLFPELRQIAVKSFGVREPIEAVLNELSGEIDHAFIFGSIATGTDTPDSDVDVMIIGDVRLGKVTRLLNEASRRLGRDVHVNVYSSIEWEELIRTDSIVRAIDEGPKIELSIAPHAE